MLNSNLVPDDRRQRSRQRAAHFRDQIVQQTQAVVPTERPNEFYPALFRRAATAISQATDEFCDRAEQTFEEIDAYGKEPGLDDDWLQAVTGEKESFYFSTDNLVTEPGLLPLPRKQRQRAKPQDERAVVEAVENAIAQTEDVLKVAHLEDPTGWINAIAQCLRQADEKLEFWQLHERTGLSPGALLLALLLGQEGKWNLSQDGFYGTLWVGRGWFY